MSTSMSPKKRVYLNEYNILMEKTAYLPIAMGLLRAYAETSELICSEYEFMPFLYHLDVPSNILAQYEDPKVAAFSVSMWNEQLNLHIAREIKSRYPECLIVFGGPQVPHYPAEYFAKYPFIDVTARGEGEEAFSEILIRNLESRDFSGLAGVSFRHPQTGECVRSTENRPQSRDLDIYPSPYLEGLYDQIVASRPDITFQAIVETNRGCPFPCAFCFWGQGGLSRKYRFHGMDRIKGELAWIAQNKIKYVFNADSNFGMHPRDREIAEILVETKKEFGFPEKFRTCFGKNTDDKIYEIAMLLHEHELEKGITLSRQSNDEKVLENIRRQNIKLSTYNNLQYRFNEGDVPVYSELILGLPGENYESWTRGIEEMLQAGIRNQLFVYLCQVFPNTELANLEYQKQFGIKTQRIILTEIHGKIRPSDLILEYEDIIVNTDAMSIDEWKRMALFSWTMMVLHSLKLGFFVMQYLVKRHGARYTDFIAYIADLKMPENQGAIFREEVGHFRAQTEALLNGQGRGREMPEYGQLYWDEEEASFLRISERLDQFYAEFFQICSSFLADQGINYDPQELSEVIIYQRSRIPTTFDSKGRSIEFNFNFPEYFEKLLTNNPVELVAQKQLLQVTAKEYNGDKRNYSKETILWGRKSGTMLTKVEWSENEASEHYQYA
jgi:radical SAM superfamily enzyme YgiQ (UPF0313 family)